VERDLVGVRVYLDERIAHRLELVAQRFRRVGDPFRV
jgi:hypothetical protein